MAIIQAGKQFSVEELKATVGNHAAMLRDTATNLMQMKAQYETWVDADLIALGLTQEEINAQKGFVIGDAPAIYNLIVGSTWIKQLLGTGV